MRLFHKLFLLFSAIAMVSALAMAVVLAWNLNRGFGEYLDTRDAEQLDRFADDFESILQSIDQSAAVVPASDDQLTSAALQRLLEDGIIRQPPFRPPPDRIGDERPKAGPDGPRGRRRSPPEAFEARLRISDKGGIKIFGPPGGARDIEAKTLSRRIMLDGRQIATVSLLPRGPTPERMDAGFLRGQYTSAAIVFALLLLLSVATAWWLARRSVRQIVAFQDATGSIAGGDFSARVEARGRDEIAQMGSNINAMAEGLGRLDSARRRWLAEISHELRTPLTILQAELNALEDGIRPLDIKAVNSLSEEAQRLGALIEDLHFLAVSDLDTPAQNLSQADAVALLQDVADRFGPALNEAGLTLKTDCGALSDLPVVWDKQRIEQLLGNIVTNNMRYTDAPGTVRIALSVDGDSAVIEVDDSAPGVPDDQLSRLFDPLYRLEDARDRVSGGSGLGLSVAEAIAAAHGGQIAAAASDFGGLKITIILPLDASMQ